VCGRAQDGFTPLQKAAWHGHLECARLLLERGADKEAKGNVRAPCLTLPRRAASERSATRSLCLSAASTLRFSMLPFIRLRLLQ
jgi:ankyrin repeat protein